MSHHRTYHADRLTQGGGQRMMIEITAIDHRQTVEDVLKVGICVSIQLDLGRQEAEFGNA